MTCADSRIFLAAYLDDELDVTESLRVQAHLTGCARCRQARNEQLALRSALRDPGLHAYPRAEFAKRLDAAVRDAAKEEAKAQRSARFSGWGWMAVAAAMMLAAAVGSWMAVRSVRSSHEQTIAAAVVADHIRSLQAEHLTDVLSTDRHTVKPWFQGKLDFSPPVPDLTDQGFNLIGGRLDYLEGRPVAALVYRRALHTINVFVWPETGSADETLKQRDSQGYQILHWNSGGMAYWVASDLNAAELMEFARDLRAR